MSGLVEHFPFIEIDGGSPVCRAVFSSNGEFLVSGHNEGVRVWRVQDGKRVSELATPWNVTCLAVSKDGRWIAAGTLRGLLVWDANTYKRVFEDAPDNVNGVDFSPDSTRLLVATANRTATVWDVAARKPALDPLRHGGSVIAGKYSPRGHRFATATQNSVRVYKGDNGRLLVDIKVKVAHRYNSGLFWSNDQLFIVSEDKIKQVETTAGSVVSEWSVPNTDHSCVAMPQDAQFIVYSTGRAVTFLDTSTHAQIEAIQRVQDTYSMVALSPDCQSIAIWGTNKKISVHRFSHIPSMPGRISHDAQPTSFQEPEILVDDAIIELWCRDRLDNAETLLTNAIASSSHPSHQVFASRALIRARLRKWDAAIDDAKQSIQIHPSAIAYIAQSIVFIGRGERHAAYRVCDITFENWPSHISYLLLAKAVIVSMASEHEDAISRMDDLIAAHPSESICHVVQAYMFLLLGNSRLESGDCEEAVNLFERSRAQLACHRNRLFLVITLISGWNFDSLEITIQQRLCESLYAAGRLKEGVEALLEMVNTFEGDIYADGSITKWVSDFTCQCLSVPQGHDNVALEADQHTQATSTILTPLLKVWARSTLTRSKWKDALAIITHFTVPKFTIYQAICERLEITCMTDAVECFTKSTSELSKGTIPYEHVQWVSDFKQRCAIKLEHLGDAAMGAGRYEDAIVQYSVAISLDSGVQRDILIKRSKVYATQGMWDNVLEDASRAATFAPLSIWDHENVLLEWAKVKLADGSWRNALTTANDFKVLRFAIYQALCERLERMDRIMDATECFHCLQNEFLARPLGANEEWVSDFKSRCWGKLESAGNSAMFTGQYDTAISHYSAALSLNPTTQGTFIERSKAYLSNGSWVDALSDANKAITLDPSSPWGYERKYAALLKAGERDNAMDTFAVMVSKMSHSSDPGIRERSRQYVTPEQTKAAIYIAIQNAIRDSPLVLINTYSGRLLDKSAQASLFESQPIFAELVVSMTTHIDHARIEREVASYYQYTTFSHKWEDNEPPYEKVIQIAVYNLEDSPTHHKLQMFCKIVRDFGYHWAWSDTCCINKADHFVLQEALVSMFKWYEGSAMTIVFLCDVSASSRRGALWRSIWNTRGWTFQEYHASKVVRFYTKDWTPYLNLDIHNHKESPEIISEMEGATGVSARSWIGLQPGFDDVREKLRLASTRKTTRIEDAAYSLLGIFSVAMPIVYGEGDQALGRLLAQVLTSSGDTSILAWTGKPSNFNSCLPADIVVFSQLPTSHIPSTVESSAMDIIVTKTRASPLNYALVTELCDRLNELSIPLFVGQRLRLPCITFKLGHISASRDHSDVFRAQTAILGVVEIRTQEDLSRLDSFYLVHPWIDYLLGRQPVGSITERIPDGRPADDQSVELPPFSHPSNVPPATSQVRAARLISRLGLRFGGGSTPTSLDVTSLRPPSTVLEADKKVEALQVIARLRQPFGALLLTPKSGNVAAYRRVAAEGLITVQIEEMTAAILHKVIDSVRTIDVL